MEYPTHSDHWSGREKLTYCLGAITVMEAILCDQLRGAWADANGESIERRRTARITSGNCVKELVKVFTSPDYDWVPECRATLRHIGDVVRERDEALHSLWLPRGDEYISPKMIHERLPAKSLEHFEELHHRLDIAADNAVGVGYFIRATKMRSRGERLDPKFEQINRELVARLP